MLNEASSPENGLSHASTTDPSFFTDRRVCVTGGAGFLGSYVIELLRQRGCRNIFIPNIEDYNLTQHADVVRLYRDVAPDVVIHLAAVVGGIGADGATRQVFLRKADHGDPADSRSLVVRSSEIRSDRNDLRLPEAILRYPSTKTICGGIPRGNECPVRTRQKDAARSVTGVPITIRVQFNFSASREPVRSTR